jgi:transcription termination/antitermination protein NusG
MTPSDDTDLTDAPTDPDATADGVVVTAPEAAAPAATEAATDEAPDAAPAAVDEAPEPTADADAAVDTDADTDTDSALDTDTDTESESDTEADADVEVLTDDELLAQQPVVDNPFTRPGRWFVVHTQSGYEKKVKQNLEARIHSMNAEEAVYEVVIPMEDYVDFKNGKRVVAQRKMFPGYLLVRAELDDTAWFVIRNTPGVTGFVGQGAKPSPLPRRDVEAFLMPKGGEEQVSTRTKPRLEYEIGETVRVREGPFADFSGEVIELNEDQLKLKVLVNIFGRETPVELEFSKVAKL